jgi:FkbM family methyltransferase
MGRYQDLKMTICSILQLRAGLIKSHFVEFVSKILKPGDVVIDLGGNIGTHSLLMSDLILDGRVITFEPQSLTYSILQNNILLNNRKNIYTYRFACSDKDFETISMQPFSFVGESINNGALRVDLNGSAGDLALTRTIDSFNFEKLSFMKIDIQGSEVKALMGAKKTISKHKPYMFVEIEQQHLLAMNTSAKELIELILSLGYSLYRIENSYPCDHICVPNEKAYKFEEDVLPNLDLTLSSKISGSEVELSFENQNAQNYSSIISR